MRLQPTSEQLSYQERVIRVTSIARNELHRHNRIGSADWDGGNLQMLPDSATHTLRFRTG
jgi:hypothetical protein